MRKLLLTITVVAALFAAMASAVYAHTSQLIVQAVCNAQTGNYELSWVSNPTDQNKAPKIFASNRAAIGVGTSVPATFQETIPGTSTFVSATVTIRWNDNFKAPATASKSLAGTCTRPVTPPEEPPVTPPVTPPQTNREGFCDPTTGEYLDLAAGQDKVEPYASRGLVPAVDGACPKLTSPPAVVSPPKKSTPKPPAVKKPKPKAKPHPKPHHPKPAPKPKPPLTKLPFTG